MDKSESKLNHIWTNRASIKSSHNGQQSVFFDGSSNLIKSRFFTILVVTLISIVFLNLILSFWIIHSLQIGNGGLGDGNLLSTIKRMTVRGKAIFNGWLTAEEINPVHRDQWLSIVGLNDQLKLVGYDSRDYEDEIKSNVFTMSNFAINYQGPNLIVHKFSNGSKKIQFSINSNQLITNSLAELKTNDWGLVVDETLETTAIKGDHYHDLRLESRMKGLTMEALTSNLNLKSKVGQISMNSLRDITLSARRTIRIDSSRIHFNSLIKSKSGRHHNHQIIENGTNHRKETIAYQLCICENGRLFLAHGNKACFMSPEVCSYGIDDKME